MSKVHSFSTSVSRILLLCCILALALAFPSFATSTESQSGTQEQAFVNSTSATVSDGLVFEVESITVIPPSTRSAVYGSVVSGSIWDYNNGNKYRVADSSTFYWI
jgi:hypothetical protein